VSSNVEDKELIGESNMKEGDKVVDTGYLTPEQRRYIGTEAIVIRVGDPLTCYAMADCLMYDGEKVFFYLDKLRPAPTLKRGDMALFWSDDETKAVQRIYLCEVRGAIFSYKAIAQGFERNFKRHENGDKSSLFVDCSWKHCKPLPQEVHFTLPTEDAQKIKKYTREGCGNYWDFVELNHVLEKVIKQVP
jgi:hypothetical protein